VSNKAYIKTLTTPKKSYLAITNQLHIYLEAKNWSTIAL